VSRLRFDPRRPLFVATQPLQAFGKVWPVESPFPWEDMGMGYQEDTIHHLYASNMLQHRPDLEGSLAEHTRKAIGDGLESYTIDALHQLVDKINKDVRLLCKTQKEFSLKKCPSSRIKDRQIGLIRRWRSTYGDLEQ
jgi:hypothetical protein